MAPAENLILGRTTSSFEQARTALYRRLWDRRAEIEQAVLTRAYAISDPTETFNPEYLEGLRATIPAAVDFGLAVIEKSEERTPPIPPVLLTQARLAARNGIGLDTVLRRYTAGYMLLSDFLIEEVDRIGLRGADLRRLLRAQAALDRVFTAVSEEYAREARQRPGTVEQRRAERIERLLAGELLDTTEFAYDFDGFHLGMVAFGEVALEAVRDLASRLDCRVLAVRRDEGSIWAWLGSRRQIDAEELLRHGSAPWPADARLALGEPAASLSGWRLTHRQARAAVAVARCNHEPLVLYADVVLISSALRDDLLLTSLRKLFLEPLQAERGGGEALQETLRAYFSARRNVSSAAATLGLNRSTVAYRLQTIEDRLQRPLDRCMAELETLIRLESLERPPYPAKDS
jgi:hypothetical protein